MEVEGRQPLVVQRVLVDALGILIKSVHVGLSKLRKWALPNVFCKEKDHL